MKKTVLLIALVTPLMADYYSLCDDAFFTNTFSRVDADRLIQSYPNAKLSKGNVDYLYQCAERYKINPLVLLIKLEQENSLVANWKTNHWDKRMSRATGYAIKNPKHHGYSNQVRQCARVLMKNFLAWTNQPAPIDGRWLSVSNGATYSLYRYCPHYGKVSNFNKTIHYATAWQGNAKFEQVKNDFEVRLGYRR